MSVWIFKSPFSVEQEKQLAQLGELPLPFDGLTDLTGVKSEAAMRNLLAALKPDAPPETIIRQADVHWARYSQLAVGDLVVVPLADKRFALAEVVENYHYRVEGGQDMHHAGIRWLETSIPYRKLSGLAPLVAKGSAMHLVEQPDNRKLVYGLRKHPSNRFFNWRWIGVALVVISEVLYVAKTWHVN